MEPQPPLWRDRHQAGELLAHRLMPLEGDHNVLLLALPRGGVAVAAAMAQVLHLPLATWSVRKVADPLAPELALGAVAPGGVVVWRQGVEAQARQAEQQGWLAAERRELERRRQTFADPDPTSLRGRRLIVVDDGIATGMTVRAALLSLAPLGPSALILAVPVVDAAVSRALAPLVDRLEALAVVQALGAVGLWYERFEQLTDQQVRSLLAPGWVERVAPGEG